MSEIINSQISVAKTSIQELCGTAISDDRAFSHVLLKNIYGVEYIDQIDLVTDGANDGGIDFLYYDEEENKVIVSLEDEAGNPFTVVEFLKREVK